MYDFLKLSVVCMFLLLEKPSLLLTLEAVGLTKKVKNCLELVIVSKHFLKPSSKQSKKPFSDRNWELIRKEKRMEKKKIRAHPLSNYKSKSHIIHQTTKWVEIKCPVTTCLFWKPIEQTHTHTLTHTDIRLWSWHTRPRKESTQCYTFNQREVLTLV